MREIKFRAWDKELEEMTNGIDNIKEKYEGVVLFDELLNPEKAGFPEVIVMQFTGLKDKNGKEIFEGDIVICIHGTYEIVFTNGSFCLNNSKSPTIGFLESPIGNYSGENLKVIGNIFENPELLEGSK